MLSVVVLEWSNFCVVVDFNFKVILYVCLCNKLFRLWLGMSKIRNLYDGLGENFLFLFIGVRNWLVNCILFVGLF